MSKIITFTKDSEPRDEKLINLLKQAYNGEILCTMAIAEIDTIQPFSNYKITVTEDYRKYFKERADDSNAISLYVYAEHDKLIMSDNYNAFAMYKELNMPRAVCVVIGDTPEIDGVAYKEESFKLPAPEIEIV